MRSYRPENLLHQRIVRKGDHIFIDNEQLPSNPNQRIWVFGSGKAAARMAKAMETLLSDLIYDGIVIVPHGTKSETKIIQQFEAAHPLPDEDSLTATLEMLDTMKQVQPNDIVFYVMSGGTSSLVCLPPDELELEEIRETWHTLLHYGLDIKEINLVRKHISKVKGGQMLKYLRGAHVISLMISDVPGDDLEYIGSGPLVPTSTTFSDAWSVIEKHHLQQHIPYHVSKFLKRKAARKERLPNYSDYSTRKEVLLGSAGELARTMAKLAEKYEYNIWVAPEAYHGDARQIARQIAGKAIGVLARDEDVKKPALLIFYGESSVSVTGNGKGGRNQEIALAASMAIEGQHVITMLSAGTDGKDGNTSAAGALCTSRTALDARKRKIEPEVYLKNNDSFHFFKEMDALFITGATGNNLMDMQLVFVSK